MLLFPIMVAMPKVDPRKCAALQTALLAKLARMESGENLVQ